MRRYLERRRLASGGGLPDPTQGCPAGPGTGFATRGVDRECCRVVVVELVLIERPGRIVVPGLAFVPVRLDPRGPQRRRSGRDSVDRHEAGRDRSVSAFTSARVRLSTSGPP